MPKKVTVKNTAPVKKSMGAALKQSLNTVKKAVYRAKSTHQPKNV